MTQVYDGEQIASGLDKGWWNPNTQQGGGCCPVHDDKNSSLTFAIGDDGKLLVTCFSGCPFPDITAKLRSDGLIPDYVPASRFFSKQERREQYFAQRKEKAERKVRQAEEDRARTDDARASFGAGAQDRGAVLRYYTTGRGIDPDVIPGWFRYQSEARHWPSGLILPMIMAPVTSIRNGQFQAITRTFLRPDGLTRADGPQSKMSLGPTKGGAVKMGVPIDTLIVSEGIENGLSASQIFGGPAWALLGTSNLRSFKPPRKIRRLIIAADNDKAGVAAARDLANQVRSSRLTVEIRAPETRGDDWNDELNKKEVA